jgi:2,3-bisphosphoglycerate-dependent phosphoglycerate mutase
MPYLILVRHGESQGNAQGIVTGITDIELTVKGHKQALEAGKLLKDIRIDLAFTSTLTRAKQTFEDMHYGLGYEVPVEHRPEFNEKSWGIQEGKAKSTHPAEWLTWDGVVPGGESYGQVGQRALAYIENVILPLLKDDKNVLIVSHNGVLKTVRTVLEGGNRHDLHDFRLGNCEIAIYELSENNRLEFKEIRLPDL